ncbi:MAG: TasA family protein [Patescibacteria group bacterium]
MLISVLSVLAVTGGAFALTRAYFSDQEKSVGNTFETGTIDIAVNGENPWVQAIPYKLVDMKPSQTDYSNFTITNVGTNPVNVWKKLTVPAQGETTGVVSEPECTDQLGTWVGGLTGSCNWGNHADRNDISTVINYDLSVKVYEMGSQTPLWFQTIWEDADGKTIAAVSTPTTGHGDLLGMIPEGGRMEVTESYHMRSDTDNWAQGDKLTFDINLYAEQLTNTVTLVSKSGADWDNIDAGEVAGKNAVLTYKVKDFDFKYNLSVMGLANNTSYVLISGTNPYNGADTVQIAAFTTGGTGAYSTATEQAINLNQNLTNAKVWVVPASHWNPGTRKMTAWNGDSYLFETALIEYYDTDL